MQPRFVAFFDNAITRKLEIASFYAAICVVCLS